LSCQLVSGSVFVVANKITPTIQWSQPSAIPYGTILNGILDATAFQWHCSGGGRFFLCRDRHRRDSCRHYQRNRIGVGRYTLAGRFTPADTTNYIAATSVASLTARFLAQRP
jgi:hypothetical protein